MAEVYRDVQFPPAPESTTTPQPKRPQATQRRPPAPGGAFTPELELGRFASNPRTPNIPSIIDQVEVPASP